MATKRALVLESNDNVGNVLEKVEPQDEIVARFGTRVSMLTAAEGIPFGFKVALVDIPRGEVVRKYGEAIGLASHPIKQGKMVHIHNLEGARGRGDLEASKTSRDA